MIDKITDEMDDAQKKKYIEDIINRLCFVYGVTKAKQLSEIFNFTENSPSLWKARGKIPYEWIHAAIEDHRNRGKQLSYYWLLTGEEDMPISDDEEKVIKKSIFRAFLDAGKYGLLPKETVNSLSTDKLSIISDFFTDKIMSGLKLDK